MLVESPSDTAGSVFFDPTSRRRRAAISVLLAVLAVAAGLAGLLLIGLSGGGHPPRTSVDRRAIIGPAARRSPPIVIALGAWPRSRNSEPYSPEPRQTNATPSSDQSCGMGAQTR